MKGGRQRESLEGTFVKAAALASCWEAIRQYNPDSLAGDSHTAGKAGRELGTCHRQLEREEAEGEATPCQRLQPFADCSGTSWESERVWEGRREQVFASPGV